MKVNTFDSTSCYRSTTDFARKVFQQEDFKLCSHQWGSFIPNILECIVFNLFSYLVIGVLMCHGDWCVHNKNYLKPRIPPEMIVGINYVADPRMTFRQNFFFKIGLETNLE
jgi:hypothetical protein